MRKLILVLFLMGLFVSCTNETETELDLQNDLVEYFEARKAKILEYRSENPLTEKELQLIEELKSNPSLDLNPKTARGVVCAQNYGDGDYFMVTSVGYGLYANTMNIGDTTVTFYYTYLEMVWAHGFDQGNWC